MLNYLSRPQITGDPSLAGNVLGIVSGAWPPGVAEIAYQWCSEGVPIPGANTNTYTLQASDAGMLITCRVNASDGTQQTTVTTHSVLAEAGQVPPDQPTGNQPIQP